MDPLGIFILIWAINLVALALLSIGFVYKRIKFSWKSVLISIIVAYLITVIFVFFTGVGRERYCSWPCPPLPLEMVLMVSFISALISFTPLVFVVVYVVLSKIKK